MYNLQSQARVTGVLPFPGSEDRVQILVPEEGCSLASYCFQCAYTHIDTHTLTLKRQVDDSDSRDGAREKGNLRS